MLILIISGSGLTANHLFAPAFATSGGPISLGTSGTFGALGLTITNANPTTVNGNVGASTNESAIPSTITDHNHIGNSTYTTAQSDLTTAIADGNSRLCTDTTISATNLGGQTLTPGVHCFSGAVSVTTSPLVLNGSGVYIFKIAGALTSANPSSISLINGAQASNVFWVVTGTTSLATFSNWQGTIMSSAAITLGASDNVNNGRVLTSAGLTLSTNTITVPNDVTPTDITPPVITMRGTSPITIQMNSTYTDAGATASDNVDGNITSSIVTVSTVNTAVAGTYHVTYDVSDAASNHAIQVIRTVNVAIPSSSMSLDVSTGPPGQSIVITGNHFTPNFASFAFTFGGNSISPTSPVTSNGTGYFSATITVPALATVGSKIVLVTDGTNTNSQSFTVTAQSELISVGAAETFGILANTFTNSGAGTSIVGGDLGYTTGTLSSPIIVGGHHYTAANSSTIYNAAEAAQLNAQNLLNGKSCDVTYGAAIDLAITSIGTNPVGSIGPGVYCITGVVTIGTSGITLTGNGVHIFKIDGAINTVAASVVSLSGGAQSSDVFWVPTGATTLGDNTSFIGTLVTSAATTLGNTVHMTGKILSSNAVTTTGPSDTITLSTFSSPPPDTTPPVITMRGTSPITIQMNSTYTDAGATASDNVDGNVTSSIVTVSTVNIHVTGPYTVTYNVSDAAGNHAIQVTRIVNVVTVVVPVDANTLVVTDATSGHAMQISPTTAGPATFTQPPTMVPLSPTLHASKPTGSIPFGMLSFNVTGIITPTTDVTLTFSENLPAGTQYFKVNATTGVWTDFTSHVTISGNTMVLHLTDNAFGDSNPITGTIRDPGVIIFTSPSIILDSSSGTIGQAIKINGTNFTPSASIAFTFGGNSISPTSPVSADINGNFTGAIITVPVGSTSGAKTVTASDGTKIASQTFTVISSITEPITLGTSGTFGVLASTYTNTAAVTRITGDLGYTTFSGVPSVVSGNTHVADSAYAQAGIDQNAATSSANSQTCTNNLGTIVDLATVNVGSGLGVYPAGVYCTTGAASIGTAGITLTGSGNHIFKIDGALTTVTGSHVTLTSGAQASNVFWVPTGATTLGAVTHFSGIILDASGITIGTTTMLTGQALAFGGTVTTTSDTILIQSSISIDSSSGPVGQHVGINGTNFAPSALITFTFDGVTIPALSPVTSNGTGYFTAVIAVPASTLCAHTIAATDGTNTASQSFTVTSSLTVSVSAASDSFAVLASSTITAAHAVSIHGDLGLFPGTSVTGPITVIGTSHIGDVAAFNALNAANAQYTTLQTTTCTNTITGGPAQLGGLTLTPGVYCSGSSMGLTGTLTLDGAGTYIFQMPSSTLVTASGSKVILINGATANNVFWRVGSSATLGTGTSFNGTIIAHISITSNSNANATGRLFALNGAVTFAGASPSTITVPSVVVSSTPLNFQLPQGGSASGVSRSTFGGGTTNNFLDGFTMVKGGVTTVSSLQQYNQKIDQQIMVLNQPVTMTFKTFSGYYILAVKHMELFFMPNDHNLTPNSGDIASITYDDGKPTLVKDPQGIIKHAGVGMTNDGKYQYFTFKFTPNKSFATMTFVAREINDHNFQTEVRVHDAYIPLTSTASLPLGVTAFNDITTADDAITTQGIDYAGVEGGDYVKPNLFSHGSDSSQFFGDASQGHIVYYYDSNATHPSISRVIFDGNGNVLQSVSEDLVKNNHVPMNERSHSGISMSLWSSGDYAQIAKMQYGK